MAESDGCALHNGRSPYFDPLACVFYEVDGQLVAECGEYRVRPDQKEIIGLTNYLIEYCRKMEKNEEWRNELCRMM